MSLPYRQPGTQAGSALPVLAPPPPNWLGAAHVRVCVWRGVQGLATLPLMLPTHQEQACPVCLHAPHKGKLITHLGS